MLALLTRGIPENIIKIMKIEEIFWEILGDSWRLWQLLGDSGKFWEILRDSGRFIEILRDSGRF